MKFGWYDTPFLSHTGKLTCLPKISSNNSPLIDEVAFYDALAENESAVRELGDETLKKIAQEITDKLRKSTTVDWQKRDSVRAKLRNLVRIPLRKYKYPPDKTEAAIELVLRQAEVLSNEWSKD